MNIQKVLLKVLRAIRDFVAHRIDSSVARESKKASCAALRSNASRKAFLESSDSPSQSVFQKSSKNASRKESRKACGSCTRRALLSLFVASATLLATFVIAPTSALSAGESGGANTASTEKTEGAQSGSAKNDDEKKQQTKQSESNNAELNKNNADTSSTLNKDNKKSNLVEKQQNAGNNGVDKAKSDETAVKKNVKKKDVDSAKAVNGTERGANEESQLPPECNGKKKYNTPEKCYSITYGNRNIVNIKGDNDRPYTKVHQIFKPTIEVAGNKQETLPAGVWLELKKFKSDDSVNYAFFKGENDKNDSYTAKSTKKVANSDGSIRFFPSKWLKTGKYYKFNVVIHYPGGSESKAKKIIATLAKDDLPKPKSGDLTVKVHNFGSADSTTQTGDSDKKSVSITIKLKPKGSAPAGSTAGSDDNKDTYDSINKLFIDSQSKDKRGELYHHMICNDGANNYTVDSVNGLSLKDKKDNPSEEKQTQFKHMVNEKRPDSGAADSAVYEDDDYIERSQSWITGTPTSAGTFECKVFAFKNANLTEKSGKHFSNLVDHFKANAETDVGKKSLFKGNIVDSTKWKTDDFNQGVDWDYKSVTIEVKSNNPPKLKPPKIGDNDLTLKVYPFKNSDGSLPAPFTSDNKGISAILGMSLKPFVDATSAADSKNPITLRVLCSKGEKKGNAAGGSGASTGGTGLSGSGPAGSGSSGANAAAGSRSSAQSGSQSAQPSESSQPAEDPEYKTWSSNLAELGLSVPPDDDQNTCHSDKEGDTICKSSDPSKKVAARTDKEVSIKPTAVGDYQCVVFALKPKVLDTFNGLKGSLTPESIKSALTAAPASFKENKDFAAFTLNIHLASNFTLPHTGGQSWNLQLGILAALLVNLLAAGFVVSQSERGRKLILGRWRGLCNHV